MTNSEKKFYDTLLDEATGLAFVLSAMLYIIMAWAQPGPLSELGGSMMVAIFIFVSIFGAVIYESFVTYDTNRLADTYWNNARVDDALSTLKFLNQKDARQQQREEEEEECVQ